MFRFGCASVAGLSKGWRFMLTELFPLSSGLLHLHGLISPLERVLCVGIALRGGFLIPLYGLRRILEHAFTIFVHRPQSILCIGRSLRCVLLQLRQANFCGWALATRAQDRRPAEPRESDNRNLSHPAPLWFAPSTARRKIRPMDAPVA